VVSLLENPERRFQMDPDLAWIMTEVGPKTIVNPRTVEGVGTGTHRIVEKGRIKPTVIRPDDMIIAHVPFSTYNRFAREMGNIERSLTVFGHRLNGS